MQTLANRDAGPGPWILFLPLIWAAVFVGAANLLRRPSAGTVVDRGARTPVRTTALTAWVTPRSRCSAAASPPGRSTRTSRKRRLSVLDEQFGPDSKGGAT